MNVICFVTGHIWRKVRSDHGWICRQCDRCMKVEVLEKPEIKPVKAAK